MGAPHNKNRYGELWNQDRIDSYLEVINKIKDIAVLSGGWAWHFISLPGHAEYKHSHDHKDLDIFVKPENVAEILERLYVLDFHRVWTRYDRLASPEEFRRYEKTTEKNGRPFRLTIDFFVNDVPTVQANGATVVEPSHLLTLYSSIHSSDKCFAVQAAYKLLQKNISPLNRPELTQIPTNGG